MAGAEINCTQIDTNSLSHVQSLKGSIILDTPPDQDDGSPRIEPGDDTSKGYKCMVNKWSKVILNVYVENYQLKGEVICETKTVTSCLLPILTIVPSSWAFN